MNFTNELTTSMIEKDKLDETIFTIDNCAVDDDTIGLKKIDITENLNTTYLDKTKYNVFRLDGHNFSKLTKEHFKKPFDVLFNNAMKECATYLYEKFNFKLSFVGSDEISVVYYPIPQEKIDNGVQFQFNGKLFKYLSILPSIVSSVFTLKTGIINSFDCRHFTYDAIEQVQEYLIYRRIYTVKNSKMMLAQHYFSATQLHKKKSNDAVKMLLEEKGIDYFTCVEETIRRGVMIYNTRVNETKEINKKIKNEDGEYEIHEETINYTRKKSTFIDSVEESIKNNEN